MSAKITFAIDQRPAPEGGTLRDLVLLVDGQDVLRRSVGWTSADYAFARRDLEQCYDHRVERFGPPSAW
jgi:hypothetical protein